MKTAIVTGANGFIGSALVRELLENQIFVYAFVHKDTSNLPKNENLKLIHFSLENMLETDFARDVEIDAFYHMAWQGSAGTMRGDFYIQHKNVQATVEAVKFAAKIKAKRFVGAGSLMEKEARYDIPKRGKKPALSTLYGSAKLSAHYMSKAVAADEGIEHVWTYLTAYGVGDSPYRLINTVVRKMVKNEPYIDMTEGRQLYDFVYMTDVARALFLLGECGMNHTAYHIGSGSPKQLRDFMIEAKEVLQAKTTLNFGALGNTGVYLPREEFLVNDIMADTGFSPVVTFREGILKVAEEARG